MISPADIGMPPEFPEWREGQGEAIDELVDDFHERNTVVMCAPVGSGKTVTYVGLALLMRWRVLCVTSTKTLQDQLMRDFGDIGMVDIRGRQNYPCKLGASLSCEEGQAIQCNYANTNDCPYRSNYNAALKARFVTTNYTYKMLIYMYGEGLGKFDLVVFDEAHDAPPEVCAVMGQTFTTRHAYWMLKSRFPTNPGNMEEWMSWARLMLPIAIREQEALAEEIKLACMVSEKLGREMRQWNELVTSLTVVSKAIGPWGCEEVKGYGGQTSYRMEPLWPRQYAKQVLFRDHPRVLLPSATVRPKTMDLMGMEPGEYAFHEYPFLFPVGRCPIYFIPTSFIRHDSTAEEMELLQRRIDEIMDARQDRNGIIHAVSYKLRDWIMDHCIYNHVMMTHERKSESTRKAIERFEAMQRTPPVALVSPSIATGNDFKYRKAEYQIIPKLPFVPVTGSPIMEARCRKTKGGDPAYADYLMCQNLAQAFGRIMRAGDDRGETFVLDNHFEWACWKLKSHFPRWVNLLVRRRGTVPKPPPALALEGK